MHWRTRSWRRWGDAYDPSLERFELTEQQLLDDAPAPIPHPPGHTLFDVSPFVLFGGGLTP
jgi:hypothetical protein